MTNDKAKSKVVAAPPPGIKINRWWTVLAILIAGSLRLLAALGDLEIDEVWTIEVAELNVKSFGQIFFLRHDNNHLLNTMIVYALGPHLAGVCYRIPAVLASIATVWLAGRNAIRRGGVPSVTMAWILFSASYLLVLYGTEARGYSYAVFFSYLSWLALQRVQEKGRWSDAALFAISASLGFLSHLTFLYCYVGFCVWTIWKWIRRPAWIWPIAHCLPIVVAGGLYLFFMRGMMIGGGPQISTFEAIVTTLSIFMGGPLKGDIASVLAFVAALILVCSFIAVLKLDLARACCYLTIVVLAPAGVLMVVEHSLIYPRYFLIPAAFGLLMISEGLSGWWHAGKIRRILLIGCCGIYLIGNLWWNVLLLDNGRGGYSKALEWMNSQPHQSFVTVSSDHDFRNGIMFDYYARSFPPGKFQMQYVANQAIPRHGTDWHIRHNFDGDKPHPQVISDSTGIAYRLKRTYKHRGLAGWNWWIYQRIDKNDSP